MKHESNRIGYRRRLNDALAEAGEPQLGPVEAYDFYKSRPSCEDALILKLSDVEQSAPSDLINAFDRSFGRGR